MSNIYKLFKTNKNAEQKGVAVDLGKTDDGKTIRIYVARFGGSNNAAIADWTSRTANYAKAIEAGSLSEEDAESIVIENTAESLITGWENVTNEAGIEIPYSKENALILLSDLPEVVKKIRAVASDVSLYLESNKEAIVKN